MEVNSKFRKLFWVRIGICFFVFILGLFLCIRYILHSSSIIKNPVLIFSLVFFFFLIYMTIGLFSIFRINVTDKGIEKTVLLSGKKEFIPFGIITGLKKQKIRMRRKSGALTDGYTVTILKLQNGKELVISPDDFENYKK
ncbi:hypothetical protein [Flavobacterium aquidurense]|uniref:hypothetical protein n=1 Tax=Flavobacterium aquidurense TaxID=362413 RepID=UPI00285E7FB2|nr:hypothetical protein [Flavobacterium aquidurense]MDR7370400.1 hypothetical protein [Flavobacterium aquidurense]